MFVDDTDLPVMATSKGETLESVAGRLQRAVTCWAGALTTTGGALRPDKCFWYSLGFTWTNGKWDYKKAANTEILVPDFTGERQPIEHLGAHDAREVMGVWQTPAGDMEKQLSELKDKLTSWQGHISNGYLHRRVIWWAFWSTIWRSVHYPLPAMTFSAREGDDLLHPFYRKFLPSLGVNRNLPPSLPSLTW